MAQEEQVLVVERKVLEQAGMFQGLTFDVADRLDHLLAQGVPRFMSRSQAETDPNYKQIIPYVILTHSGKVLSYVRGKRAGEARLIGNRSIGIGGHINPIDSVPLFNTDFHEVYRAAVEREVAEEVSIQTTHTDRVVALLNDDSTEVGQVHLGIVHLWELTSPNVTKNEQMITQLNFMTIPELQGVKDTLETWSSLCLDHIEEMTLRAGSESRTDPVLDHSRD
jgi:predicted NUDIX family phosphoesterase